MTLWPGDGLLGKSLAPFQPPKVNMENGRDQLLWQESSGDGPTRTLSQPPASTEHPLLWRRPHAPARGAASVVYRSVGGPASQALPAPGWGLGATALGSEDITPSNFHVLEDEAFGWELVLSLGPPSQDPGTEIFQMREHFCFSDEVRCPWDLLG